MVYKSGERVVVNDNDKKGLVAITSPTTIATISSITMSATTATNLIRMVFHG